eukprot:15452600-Alexandrium_andersonii.AAC.1
MLEQGRVRAVPGMLDLCNKSQLKRRCFGRPRENTHRADRNRPARLRADVGLSDFVVRARESESRTRRNSAEAAVVASLRRSSLLAAWLA